MQSHTYISNFVYNSIFNDNKSLGFVLQLSPSVRFIMKWNEAFHF